MIVSIRRIFVFLIGLLIYAYAVCLTARADVGISPISSIAFVFTLFTPYSLGMTQLGMNIAMVLIQVALLGREFRPRQFLQIAASVVFSVFIDLLMPLTGMFETPSMSLAARFALYLAAMAAMATGLSVAAIADLVMLPGDGVAMALAQRLRWELGKAKVLTDGICVLVTCAISLLVLGRIASVQVGTLIAVLTVGNVARFTMRVLRWPLGVFMKTLPRS
jgi:uncharacterized protein